MPKKESKSTAKRKKVMKESVEEKVVAVSADAKETMKALIEHNNKVQKLLWLAVNKIGTTNNPSLLDAQNIIVETIKSFKYLNEVYSNLLLDDISARRKSLYDDPREVAPYLNAVLADTTRSDDELILFYGKEMTLGKLKEDYKADSLSIPTE